MPFKWLPWAKNRKRPDKTHFDREKAAPESGRQPEEGPADRQTGLSEAASRPILAGDSPDEFAVVSQAVQLAARAHTEAELTRGLAGSLLQLPVLSALLSVDGDRITVSFATDPETGQVEHDLTGPNLSPADIPGRLAGNRVLFIEDIAQPNDCQALLAFFRRRGCISAGLVPVMVNERLEKIILLGARQSGQLTQDSLRPFAELAEVTGAALEKLRLLHTLQLRLAELQILASFSQSISVETDLNNLYRVLHGELIQTFGPDLEFGVALYNREKNLIEFPYYFEKGQPMKVPPFPLGDGLTSILLQSRKPILLPDKESIQAHSGILIGEPAKSWMGIPLIFTGEVIGAVIVQDLQNENRFSQDDLNMLAALGPQIATSVRNTQLYGELKQAEALAQRRAEQVTTAAEIARDTTGTLDVKILLQKAVDLVRERFGFYHASIFLLDPESGYAVLRESTGPAGQKMLQDGHRLQVGSKSIVGQVAASGKALIVNDVTSSPTYYANPLLPDTRSELAIPLMVGERVLGALDVQSTRVDAFNNEDVSVLQILADQLAVAVVNGELFAKTQDLLGKHRLLRHISIAASASSSLEDALSSVVSGLLTAGIGDRIVILMLNNEGLLQVHASAGYEGTRHLEIRVALGQGITGQAAVEKAPIRVDDTQSDLRYLNVDRNVRSELAIPILFNEELMGVLNLENTRVAGFDENDMEILGALGNYLGAVIANIRLIEQVRRQVVRERQLFEVTSKIRRSVDLQTILETSTKEIVRVLGARRAGIQITAGAPPLEDGAGGTNETGRRDLV